MRTTCLCGLVCFLCLALSAGAQEDPNLVAPTEALAPSEEIKQFHLPPGFEIQLIVADPEIGQPTNINFDSAGRLWINSTLEYPYPSKEGKPRDATRYMTDTDGDGVPDKIHVYADGLNIPMGVAKVKKGVLGFSIPNIYLFEDTDGDGISDKREIAYSEFGFRDTHGMASSFRPWLDGWVYACHGFNNDSSVKGNDNSPVAMNSGNTYRLRPDGSHIEQWTWGQVNPFGLAFDSWGNLYSSDCHTKPAFMLLRGAYYPSFGKPHDGLGFGPEMMEHLHGSTGIAGIVVYEADHLPAEFRDNLFIGNPVTGRINRDKLEKHGSSYRAIEQPDFLWCDDRWFRPVDVTLAPDGSIYIADFYNCIIGHYEVRLDHPRRSRSKGRIWRVVYKGTPESPAKPPRIMGDLTKLDATALVKKLDDVNVNVRILATNELVDRVGPSAVSVVREAMAGPSSATMRAHGLWVIERLSGLTPEEITRLFNDADPLVRTHIVKAMGERKDWSPSAPDLRSLVIARLTDSNPFVIRAAAEVLGTHPDRHNIEPLLDVWRKTPADDTHLVHADRIALRNNLRDLSNILRIANELGGTTDIFNRFADVSVGIRNADAAQFLLAHVQREEFDRGRRHEFFHHAARYLPEEKVKDLYVAARSVAGDDVGAQIDLLRALFNAAQERGQKLPADELTWASDVSTKLLNSSDGNSCRAGIEFARDLRLASASRRLTELARSDSPHGGNRTLSLEALGQIDPKQATSLLISIVQDQNDSNDIRKPAAELLGKLRDPEGTAVLVKMFAIAPADLATFVARGLSWSDGGGDALLKCLEEGKAPADLLNDGVVSHELKFRAVPNKDARIDALKKTIPSPDESLRQLIAQKRGAFSAERASVDRGKAVFRKNCGICHQIAGEGAKIGPQLDGVGIRGLDRLLEDTLDPDRNVDQAFRRTTFLKTDGSVVNGLILRKEGAVIVIADAQGRETRLAESDVDEQQASKLSPMPSDVARMLPQAEFDDLLAYLLDQRQSK